MNILEARRRTLGKGVYKKTVEGNPAIARGSLPRRDPGIAMQGWTDQNSTEGKNLLPVDVGQSFTGKDVRDSAVFAEDGVTVSYNDISPGEQRDIYIFGDGVSSGNESSYVDIPEITPGKYHICNDSAKINFYVVVWRNSASVVLGFSNTSTVPITIEEGDKFRIFFSCNNPGDGVQEYTIHPMLIKDGGELTTYEPYTGGQPSPSPDYPQEIVSAGKYNEDTQKWEYEVKLTGKNLLPYGEGNIKIGIPYEIRGRTYILNKDGSISITTQDLPESSTGNIFIFGAVGDRKHYKLPAGKYTVSTFNGNIPNMSIQLEDEYGVNTRSVSVGKFELKEHERIAYAWLYGAAGTEWNGTIYPQLEYGGVSTSYEQYKPPQTVTLTSDRPLTKWDKLEKRNGQWGWVYKSAEIESYTDESVPGEYYSTTGQLSVGVQVWYETTTETFVPLTASEQEALNALHTYYPTTALSNDCECNMSLTYKTKKSLEVAT